MNGFLAASLDRIERWGNKLPHPFNLFLLFALAVLLVSWLSHTLGLSVTHPLTGKPIVAVNLLDRQGIQNIITRAVSNFTGFAPLGTVLVAMIGVGVAERSGLFSAALKGVVRGVPQWLISAALVFAGVSASLSVDAGYVILVPLGAVLFAQVGRHPIAGLAAAFAGVSGGFSANLLLTPLDPLLAGLTQEAARLYDQAYSVPITANYYLMIGSTLWLTLIGAAVTNWVVEPRLGRYRTEREGGGEFFTAHERKGLIAAAAVVASEIVLLLLLIVPENELVSPFEKLKADPPASGVDNLKLEITKLRQLRALGVTDEMMADVPPEALQMLKRRARNERAGEMREHPPDIRRALMACFIHLRTKEVTDDVVRMMLEMIHRIESLTERQLERDTVAVDEHGRALLRRDHSAEFPDFAPELLRLLDRPAVQLVVRCELAPIAARALARELRDLRALDLVLGRLPDGCHCERIAPVRLGA